MFIRFVLGVLAATFGFYQIPELPVFSVSKSFAIALGSIILLIVFWRLRGLKGPVDFINGFIIGFQLVFWQTFFIPQVPTTFLNQPIELVGQIEGLVEESVTDQSGKSKQQKWRFDLRVHDMKTPNGIVQTFGFGSRPKVRLSWYQIASEDRAIIKPVAGEVWQLAVKLKPNHASLNPGGFDYETYLFREGIAATGYVLSKGSIKNQPLSAFGMDARTFLTERLSQLFSNSEFRGLFLALLVGQKTDLDSADWQTLQATGTIHLMAISGLHMGIMAAIGYFLLGGLWSLSIRFSSNLPRAIKYRLLNTPKIWVAGLGALLFSTVYLTLAGYAIPTQRAWLMVLVVLLMVFLQRAFQPFAALALAALLIVIWQPTSVLSPGFWLSFVAVALIFGALFHPKIQPKSKWQKFWLIQLVLFLGLAPLIAFYYQQFPLMSLLANWIAVPFVSFYGLPVLLLLGLLDWVLPVDWMNLLVSWNDHAWQGLWGYLNFLTLSPINQMPLTLTLWQVVLIYLGLFLWVNPNNHWGIKSRLLVWIPILSILGYGFMPKSFEGITIQILDVGQAQAVVLLTPNHTIVVDTGSRWNANLDGASMAILPYLKTQNRQKIDLLVVSHSDLDHSGGTQRLMDSLPIIKAVSGQATQLNQALNTTTFTPCQAGQTWQFDDLSLAVLAPDSDVEVWPVPKNDNDHSCVIKASFPTLKGEKSILMTGDLSQAYEKRLVALYQKTDILKSTLLVAGHHGSKTASSTEFLQGVAPEMVIFSSGYQNRFGFPNQQVIEQVEAQNVTWLNTACASAISISAQKQSELKIESFRELSAKWYHHRCFEDEKGRFYQ
ncbi:DNA internalization-related competence protein ComEC/Rec2 [Thiosulfativibrio zosterae]|uniref:DNA internalization-related competence protein ComEC/Rec2 n=1 Tax=Thiosulfativibrio zosterae TaxID=2675053 RepID=A0A6F8PNF8_9GAMM|nr:DNA internalization-related competence protein ComEC/Rec2 [Thiosulfativibrio zosterae]BBP43635.1 DNA internalization-related competence protein ComEC/Rec2 [Thiosulfativibrio zosterae]